MGFENMKTEKGMVYFWYALDAFGGLGLEVVLAFGLEPLLYGHGLSEFTKTEDVMHWILTCIVWGLVAFFILKSAKKKTEFSMKPLAEKLTLRRWVRSMLLLCLLIALDFYDWGGFKPYLEYQHKGMVLYTFQVIYYFFEMLLVTLIIIFAQHAFEKWFHNAKIPFGGLFVGLSWGLAHIFTKGSLIIGLEGMLVGVVFGRIYLLMNRDAKKTYLLLALAFIL